MKCPIQLHAYHIAGKDMDIHDTECSQGECAWWGTWTMEKSEEQSGCCFPVLTSIVSEIMSRMPHEEQFRK